MKKALFLIWCALSLIFGGSAAGALAPEEMLQLGRVQKFVFTPPNRDFGYSIGDVMTITAEITTPSAVVLDERSLPAGTKKVNDWLELSTTFERVSKGNTHVYVVRYRYQVFFLTREVQRIQIPEYPLAFSDGAISFKVHVPSFSFLITPFNEKELTLDIAPDAKIRFPSVLLIFGATALFSLSLIMLFALGVIPRMQFTKAFRTQSPFAGLAAKIAEAEDVKDALLVIHDALNVYAGYTCFADTLPGFLNEHPDFVTARDGLREFFLVSNGVFFAETGGYAAGTMLPDLRKKLVALGNELYHASWKEAR